MRVFGTCGHVPLKDSALKHYYRATSRLLQIDVAAGPQHWVKKMLRETEALTGSKNSEKQGKA